MKSQTLYVVIGILVAVVVIFGFQNLSNNDFRDEESTSNEKEDSEKVLMGSISGTIEYNGLKPEEGDKGSVYIEYRDHDAGAFSRFDGLTIPFENHATWKIDNIPADKVYDARAVLVVGDGEVVTRSNTITVTVPANHEVLGLNVTYDMLPDSALEANPVSLSGHVTINGYIPSASTLSMFARKKDENGAVFEEVVRKIHITGVTTDWEWNDALGGRMYELKTEAYNVLGKLIASSHVGEKAAPSDNVAFIITSRETDPNDKVNKTISGTVKVNGNFSDKSVVHIKAKKTDDDEYKTVTTVKPSNGRVNWSWTKATLGAEYDVKPFLEEQGKDDIKGDKITTTAPSTSIHLKIDTQHRPNTPENKPELTECKDIGDNKYTASLKYENIDGADKYRLQVGKSKGEANVSNSVVNDSGESDPTLQVNINKGQHYYARYAYTKCLDCDGSSSYSHFSDSLKFECE